VDFKHVLCAVLFLVLGYWLGTKYPGVLTKVSGGAVTG
jgi:hypothetical protein